MAYNWVDNKLYYGDIGSETSFVGVISDLETNPSYEVLIDMEELIPAAIVLDPYAR